MTALPTPTGGSRREWLLTDRPQSRRQARLGQAYRTWLAFRGNWLAMLGLGIASPLPRQASHVR